MAKRNGILIISLDLEQYWGLGIIPPLAPLLPRLWGGGEVIPKLLDLFQRYEIHATWAVVGLLFCDNFAELLQNMPAIKPNYANKDLSPYHNLAGHLGAESENPLKYAPSLIKTISSLPHQEIATHTFSHYYCLEDGHNQSSFKADLDAAIRIAEKYNLTLQSIVFPKNQINPDYMGLCREKGIKAYRGDNSHWLYRCDPLRVKPNMALKRLRFIDLYLNLSGHHAYPPEELGREIPLNIRASRQLRPYGKTFRKLRALEPFRLARLKSALTHAARNGLIYHLWWHPHDFGLYQQENLAFLQRILEHQAKLREDFAMESLTMGELSRRLLAGID
jgi:peptidoglycan/xylan/chitin deacetylase (PgdA/CDA1 family)